MWFSQSREPQVDTESAKPVNWHESYEHIDDSPYGTYIFYEILRKQSEQRGNPMYVIEKRFSDTISSHTSKNPAVYMLVADRMQLMNIDVRALKTFVEKGNYAFIASEKFHSLINEIVEETGYHSSQTYRMEYKLNFIPEALQPAKKYPFTYYNSEGRITHQWSFFTNLSAPDEEEYDYLQTAQLEQDELGNPVYLRIPYGEGAFYLHTVPMAFSNISLLQERNLEHLEKVLSFLPEGPIFWDHYGQLRYTGSQKGNLGQKKNPSQRQSPLQFILSIPALRWAYYLLLVTLLIYILFQVKRRQKIIPAAPKNENNSLEFADTLSKVYLKQMQHKNLVAHQQKIFFHFVRDRYFVHLSRTDEKSLPLLANKSGIAETRLKDLFDQFNAAQESQEVSNDTLIDIHRKLEYFYQNCK